MNRAKATLISISKYSIQPRIKQYANLSGLVTDHKPNSTIENQIIKSGLLLLYWENEIFTFAYDASRNNSLNSFPPTFFSWENNNQNGLDKGDEAVESDLSYDLLQLKSLFACLFIFHSHLLSPLLKFPTMLDILAVSSGDGLPNLAHYRPISIAFRCM